LRKLYGQFFSNEYKSSQDKIRNKNSIFKELFETTVNEFNKKKERYNETQKKYKLA